ncbi:hypothetical protein KO507_11605 [Gilvimarinus agarilyticus]|uniref:phosphoribosyltransferase-like protein n=1 Tax=Gilvimarinus sp. 2_MG-2023 TaxID=3062666 RepID=UPI001C08B015|nr:hypothetical protein [Gilvimarinus sp. 2_MG-2023]MBU2886409.1 hypothetical protein [Gilvimarinus agarilyticus]MDO6571090.1 hypothetical protein [Gilvimarinus sp. 2_MG-2023]
MKPAAWLRNFEKADQKLAATLLDRFVFYNSDATDMLLKASWRSIADGLPKGPSAPGRSQLLAALKYANFVPVHGEAPNPTDSGYLFCRKARQILGIPECRFSSPEEALEGAKQGVPVVFLDDFVGSGDQFIETWQRAIGDEGMAFMDVYHNTPFPCIYLNLVTTDYGLEAIKLAAPNVALCSTHILTEKSTIQGLIRENIFEEEELNNFLTKYTSRLRPEEDYIAQNLSYRKWGYKNRGLMLGFEHSIPDATLPIFWSPGDDGWEPLIERS